MESCLKDSLQLENSVDMDDSKYFTGLSTILVATIQEVKDRVTQIEFIFCNQLFPNFQSRTTTLQKKLVEVKRAMKDDSEKREASLKQQIEELSLKMEHFQAESRRLVASLEHEKAKSMNNEIEKRLLLANLESLEKSGAELKEKLKQKDDEVLREKELQEKLLHKIDMQDNELSAEKEKRIKLTMEYVKLKEMYKSALSQNKFLLQKTIDAPEKNPHDKPTLAERDPHMLYPNKKVAQDPSSEDPDATQLDSMPEEQKKQIVFQEGSDNGKSHKLAQQSEPKNNIKFSAFSSVLRLPKRPANAHAESFCASRRLSSSWRGTRARQGAGGADPHDDFLDTPIENIRGNLNNAQIEQVPDCAVPLPKDMDFNNSDEETQEMNVEPVQERPHASIPKPGGRVYKYIEPVRKKAERENLKGVECKQCKKFYDAVLPKDGVDGQRRIRCEHHDGVSRHRYRYVPPDTPEGFWNIGFDSDV
ncbi:Protein gamma response 1 [Acorus gramineus]|uniref:Protein gamma response 1 n=1 Tax=Acorus gramineus TaxID=55184 RepID=A0AAV9A4R7_ACOGR|nr:Protein gamma response 1 [Acorus gramineus]